MPKPLEGLRVVDFTHVFSGPFATNLLVHLGADVIKIESPEGGDVMRNYTADSPYGDLAPPFIAINCGKRSVCLDLKSEEGKEALRRLVATADAVVENFRPGVIDRLGFGYDACKAINPEVIFCSVSGFGQTGDWRHKAAIDQIIQSVSGVMSITGEPGSASTRVGFPVIDSFAGAMAAVAIISALLQRERFGGGQYVDVSMLDTGLLMMFAIVVPHLITGERPKKYGNRGFSMSPTADTFPTAGGEVTLGAVQQRRFEAVCKILGADAVAADPRFASKGGRIKHADEVREALLPYFKSKTALEWEALFSEGGVAAGAVREIPEVVKEPFLAQRGTIYELDVPELQRQVRVLGAGFVFGHDGPSNAAPPPRLGAHTDEVLDELGLKAEIRI